MICVQAAHNIPQNASRCYLSETFNMQPVKITFLVITCPQNMNVSPLTCVFSAFQLLCAFYGGTWHYSLNTVNKGTKHLLMTPTLLLMVSTATVVKFLLSKRAELTCLLDRI